MFQPWRLLKERIEGAALKINFSIKPQVLLSPVGAKRIAGSGLALMHERIAGSGLALMHTFHCHIRP